MSTQDTTNEELTQMPTEGTELTENTTEEVVAAVVETAPVEEVKEAAIELPTNQAALDEQLKTLEGLKTEVQKALDDAATSQDFKNARKNIVETKEQILALFLIPKNERDEQIAKLQNAFEILTSRQDEHKAVVDKEYDDNFNGFKPKFDEVINTTKESKEFKVSREKLIAIQNELKEIKIKRDKKDELFAQIQVVFEDLNKRQDADRENFEMESSENYHNIKPKIDAAISESKVATNFKDARQNLIQVQTDLKDLKLKKDKRDELYGIIRTAFDELNKRQDEQRSSFDAESSANWEKLVPLVDEAIAFSKESTDFAQSREKLINAQTQVKELTLTRAQRDELFGKIREVFSELNEKQGSDRESYDKECNDNFSKLEVRVSEAIANLEYSNDFRDIREGLIAVQDEVKILKLKRDQRNDLFKRIREAFNKFDAKRNEFNDKRKVERKSKLEGLVSNLESKLSRLVESLKADNENLNSQKEKLSQNPEDFAANENIKMLETRIADKENSQKETVARIEELKGELAKL